MSKTKVIVSDGFCSSCRKKPKGEKYIVTFYFPQKQTKLFCNSDCLDDYVVKISKKKPINSFTYGTERYVERISDE